MADEKPEKVVKTPEEKIQSHLEAIVSIAESNVKKEGKSPENLAFDKLMSPVVAGIKKGKNARDDKSIGDDASKFSRLVTPTVKDYEKLIRNAAHRWYELVKESKDSEETSSEEANS